MGRQKVVWKQLQFETILCIVHVWIENVNAIWIETMMWRRPTCRSSQNINMVVTRLWSTWSHVTLLANIIILIQIRLVFAFIPKCVFCGVVAKKKHNCLCLRFDQVWKRTSIFWTRGEHASTIPPSCWVTIEENTQAISKI